MNQKRKFKIYKKRGKNQKNKNTEKDNRIINLKKKNEVLNSTLDDLNNDKYQLESKIKQISENIEKAKEKENINKIKELVENSQLLENNNLKFVKNKKKN